MTASMPDDIRVGMKVVGSHGDHVGTVKDVRADDFVVDRMLQRAVAIPKDAVRDVTGNTIELSIPADRVENTNWQNLSMG
ncbi:MAG TPA: DUF2171 domain-containing protein [Thermomicrobiales bacterium]|nr:DUF2171 domain-containing protein [Thermomicrobiales bacterium]